LPSGHQEHRLSAYGTNEFLTDQYFFFQLGYVHRLAQLPPFLGRGVYADGVYELGKPYYIPNVSKLPNDLAAEVVVETLVGPAFIGAAYGDTGHQKWFFRIGRVF
jgi:NTE family protein